jgi:aspartate aminotransferase
VKNQDKIADLRGRIARITEEIIELAGKRNQLAQEVGRLKIQDSLPIEDSDVEDALTRDVIAACDRAGLDRRAGLKILSVLLSESKIAQGSSTSSAPTWGVSVTSEPNRKGMLRFDIGEPDFRPPRAVLEACSDAMFGFRTHYTESRGIPELREALCNYLKKKYTVDIEDGEVTVTPGGRFAIYAALASVVSEGESAILVEPNWPAYKQALRQLGAKPVVIHTSLEDSWTSSMAEIEECLRPNTKAIILSYPNNPTGKMLTPRLFSEIIDWADDHDLTVISDEIYNEYSFRPFTSVLKTVPRKFILTSSFSKTWAMTGFRVGYTVSSKDTISKISRMISLMFTSVPEFIQWGAIKALDADQTVRRNVMEMRRRIAVVCRELDRINSLEYVKPDGGLYVFPKVKKPGETGDSFSNRILKKGVSVAPGSVFGDYADFFRIALCQPEKSIIEGVRRMGEVLA